MRGAVRGVLVGAGLLALASGGVHLARRLRPGGASDRPPATAEATWVGRQACAECHRPQYDLWLGSHHDLAMDVATDRSVLGDFDGATLEHFGVTSTFLRRDGSFVVRTDGPDGELAEYPISYTFGTYPLQQYLVEFPGGRLQVLGLCWDSRPADEGGQRWFHIYPDEPIPDDDELHWTGRNQNWNFMCAECHSTGLRKGYDLAGDRYETTWAEIDVSCEACHGPGSRHVSWARRNAGRPPDPGADMGLDVRLRDVDGAAWVMDGRTGIARRSAPRASDAQVETCARCHARRRQIHGDYEYGRPLLDTHRPRLLDAGLYEADGQMLDEVYVYGSYLQSAMHGQGVTCSDCHDPHSLALRAQGNALCARCHLASRFDTPKHHFHEPGTPGSLCVDCHMPVRTYMVVDPRRDHSFRVPRPDLTLAIGTSNACNDCHADQSAEWAAAAVSRWYERPRTDPHYGRVLHAGRTRAPGAGAALAGLAGDADQPGIVRATALSLLPSNPDAAAAAAVAAGLDDPDALARLAALEALDSGAAGDLARAVPLLDDPVRAVRLEAARVLAPAAAAVPPATRDRLAAAIDQYVESELTDADRPETHVILGDFHASRGALDQAEASYRTAIRLDPRHVIAYVNLADLERARGRDADAEPLLRRALEIDPRSAGAYHALGLLLVRRGRLADAVELLARAAELDAGSARFAYVYAVALNTAGRPADAIAELERAHAAHPDDRDILAGLVAICRDAGDSEAASRYARKLAALP